MLVATQLSTAVRCHEVEFERRQWLWSSIREGENGVYVAEDDDGDGDDDDDDLRLDL